MTEGVAGRLRRPGRLAVLALVLALAWAGTGAASLAAQETGSSSGAAEEAVAPAGSGGESGAAAPVAPAVPESVPEQPTKVWGSAWYSLGALDKPDFASISDWTASQQAGLSVNLRSNSGLEILSDLSATLDTITENNVDSVIQQLSIRFAPTNWLSVVAGKQRLKWGTGKIFAAIDKGESRSNPMDQRSVLTGLTGIKAEILPLDWLGFSLLVMPDADLRWTRAALRGDVTVTDIGLDFGLGAIKYTYNPLGLGAAGPAVDKLDRVAFMADAAWSGGDVTLYGEAELRVGQERGYWLPGMGGIDGYAEGSRDRLVFRGLAGVMGQLDLGLTRPLTVLGEYFYNGDGLNQAEAQTFRANYRSWRNGTAAGTSGVLPVAFNGLGGLRQHYAAAALNNLALDRYLLVSLMGVVGLDSGLVMIQPSLSWEFLRGTTLGLNWQCWTAGWSEAEQPTELLFLAYRNRITLTVSTGF